MKAKIYIETSIPSFYHETRQDADMIARRQWTRQWWEECRPHYDIFTSDAVLDELRRGHYPIQAETLALANQIPLLPLEEPIFEIVEVYLQHKLMPQNPLGDALHSTLKFLSLDKCV